MTTSSLHDLTLKDVCVWQAPPATRVPVSPPPRSCAESPRRMAHLTEDPSNEARWICIYPAYLDAGKTVKEGRRISKELVGRRAWRVCGRLCRARLLTTARDVC